MRGVGVELRRSFGPLDEIDLVTREDWGRVGRLARERIIARTLSGQDERDAPFAAYTPAYAKRRSQMGASTTPNLQLSGDMLNAITVTEDEVGVTLEIR